MSEVPLLLLKKQRSNVASTTLGIGIGALCVTPCSVPSLRLPHVRVHLGTAHPT